MQPAPPRGPPRAPGSFSSAPGSTSNSNINNNNNNNNQSSSATPRPPPPRQVESSSSDETASLNMPKARPNPSIITSSSATPIYASFTSHPNSSTASVQSQNFSRPTLSTAQAAARSVAGAYSPSDRDPSARDRERDRGAMSPLSLNPPTSATSLTSPSVASFSSASIKVHSRKHSASAGLFDSSLPSTSVSNLSQIGSMGPPSPRRELSASQIAAQAAVKQYSSQQQPPQNQQAQGGLQHQQAQGAPLHVPQTHSRQRSQTVPTPGGEYEAYQNMISKTNRGGNAGPLSPPLLSLTEASAPRESGFGNQGYHNGLLGNSAAAAANMVFPRSTQSSPKLPSSSSAAQPLPVVTPTAEKLPDKPLKSEKSKVKLFSRPVKIGIKSGESKEKPLPSPGKTLGQAFSSLQRGNFSTTSLDSGAQSFYSLANSSSATIKAVDNQLPPPVPEKEGKEKKHHFLSRQKHKLKDKDDYHLPLSSASSNSRPTDPSAPSSLYNFNIPPSPGPTTGFKSMSDLRHGKKKKEEKAFDDAASSYTPSVGNWAGTSLESASAFFHEPFDSSKYGLNNMTADDAWPFLKAKLLIAFEGEDLRIPVEDFNRVVSLHIQYCIARRSPNIIVEDLRDLLHTGFASLDQTLRTTPESRLTRGLVDVWVFCFTQILPTLQAVFLPLDMEFCGNGTLMTPEQARDFWGGVVAAGTPVAETPTGTSRPFFGPPRPPGMAPPVAPASTVLEVRRIVLYAFRDIVILPRYETLKTMFSQGVLSQSLGSMSISNAVPVASSAFHHSTSLGSTSSYLSTSPPDSTTSFRPGTSMSLDPGMNSYNSTSTTLLGGDSSTSTSTASIAIGRNRGLSNTSFGSGTESAPGNMNRPFTPSSTSHNREQANAEDSKQVTEMVGRMLQCMSVIASVGYMGGIPPDEGTRIVEELNKLLKLNWLGRGRTGRNRRGIVGGRVRRGTTDVVREENEE